MLKFAGRELVFKGCQYQLAAWANTENLLIISEEGSHIATSRELMGFVSRKYSSIFSELGESACVVNVPASERSIRNLLAVLITGKVIETEKNVLEEVATVGKILGIALDNLIIDNDVHSTNGQIMDINQTDDFNNFNDNFMIPKSENSPLFEPQIKHEIDSGSDEDKMTDSYFSAEMATQLIKNESDMPHCSECNRKHKPIKEHQICDVCMAMFTRKKHLLIHKRTVHKMEVIGRPKQPFCEECQKFHKPVVCHFTCELCNEKFNKMELLQRHSYKKHNVSGKERAGASKRNYDETNPLHCHTCKSSIESETYKIYHEDTVHCPEKSTHYVCRFCGYQTRRVTSTQLLEHLRTHTGEKPYKCDVCDRTFTAKKTFQNHTKTHTNEKSYKCELCFEGFNQLGGLYYHKKHRHQLKQDDTFKTYKCDQCFEDFKDSKTLKTHVEKYHSS